MVAFYTALISSIFVSNSILSGFKGMCSYLGISKNRTAAFGMGCALTFVCVMLGSWFPFKSFRYLFHVHHCCNFSNCFSGSIC